MTPPKTVSVVGFKNSGKTRVVESLLRELTDRGLMTGTIKHTADNIEFDTPGKDTSRHRAAGAKASAIIHDNASAFFVDEHLSIMDVTNRLGNLDVLIIEGFKSLNTHARILVPIHMGDIKDLSNGLEIAVISGEASATKCVLNSTRFTLKVNDSSIPLNNFVRRALSRMLLGFVSTLKGGEKAETVDLHFEVDDDE